MIEELHYFDDIPNTHNLKIYKSSLNYLCKSTVSQKGHKLALKIH